MTDDLPAPAQGLVLTHFLTVRDVARSRDFYAGVLEIGRATGMLQGIYAERPAHALND